MVCVRSMARDDRSKLISDLSLFGARPLLPGSHPFARRSRSNSRHRRPLFLPRAFDHRHRHDDRHHHCDVGNRQGPRREQYRRRDWRQRLGELFVPPWSVSPSSLDLKSEGQSAPFHIRLGHLADTWCAWAAVINSVFLWQSLRQAKQRVRLSPFSELGLSMNLTNETECAETCSTGGGGGGARRTGAS